MSKCCEKCFSDADLKERIISKTNIGDCDFCDSKEIYILDLEEDNEISQTLNDFILIYQVDTENKSDSRLLKDFIKEDWNIFNDDMGVGIIQELLLEICKDLEKEKSDLFRNSVVIKEKYDMDYLKENCIFKNKNWDEFKKEIKSNIRFHSNSFNSDVFKAYIEGCKIKIEKEKEFYRGRVLAHGDKDYKCNDLGAPPSEKANGGRANPEGIPYLYLSDNQTTVIHELRAGIYDTIFIGKFKLNKDLKIIDFTKLDKISPFILEEDGREAYIKYAINTKHLKKISDEIMKPLKNNIDRLEYLPTQYICDLIKYCGCDGIKYKSTLDNKGYNLAIFEPQSCDCCDTIKRIEVSKINYEYREIE